MSYLKCACCGEFAGNWEQFHNQDTGWGICKPCIEYIRGHRPFGGEPMSEAEIARTYGIEGVNWGANLGTCDTTMELCIGEHDGMIPHVRGNTCGFWKSVPNTVQI